MIGEVMANSNTSMFMTGTDTYITGVFKTGEVNANWHLNSTYSSEPLPSLRFEATPEGSISNTGSGKKFSVIPPYVSIYCWKRTK